MPEDFQNESHLNFLWMQLFVVGIKRCYMNLLVNSIIKLIQMLVFIWRLQFWLFFFFSQRRNTYCLLLLFCLSEFVWGSGLWLPFATCLCNSSSKCTFSVQFLQSYCVLESIASNLFSTVQFIYVFKRLLLVPDFVFLVINRSYFSQVVWSLCSSGGVLGNTCWNAVCMLDHLEAMHAA